MNELYQHELFMQRCLQLAEKGREGAAPNPMVGAVIVHEGRIIGEGYHKRYGGPHAEVNAINSVQNKKLLTQSTIYVSLEPCAHYGKTPPCAELIINKNIPKVVIGMQDPFSKVNGAGIKMLERAGISVMLGVLERECKALNKEFIIQQEKRRPYVILKWAQTLDGYIDKIRQPGDAVEPNWITNEVCRALVHKWRTEVQAIMVGTNTALTDNPKLNVRSWVGKAPLRIVIDRQLKLPNTLHLFDNSQATLVLNEFKSESKSKIEYYQIGFGDDFLSNLLTELHNRSIMTLFVEGGQELLNSFIAQKLWDESRVFIGNKNFVKGIAAPLFKGSLLNKQNLRDNTLFVYKNIQGADI